MEVGILPQMAISRDSASCTLKHNYDFLVREPRSETSQMFVKFVKAFISDGILVPNLVHLGFLDGRDGLSREREISPLLHRGAI